MGLLLNEAGDLVTRDTSTVEASATRSPQDLIPSGKVQGEQQLPVVQGYC